MTDGSATEAFNLSPILRRGSIEEVWNIYSKRIFLRLKKKSFRNKNQRSHCSDWLAANFLLNVVSGKCAPRFRGVTHVIGIVIHILSEGIV